MMMVTRQEEMEMYDGFWTDAEKARLAFRVVAEETALKYPVFVETEAQTGSRYVVVVTPLPPVGREREGGRYLVSVVWPWQDCKVINGQVEEAYVAEHLCGSKHWDGSLNGGDLAALTLTVRRALAHAGAGIPPEMTEEVSRG